MQKYSRSGFSLVELSVVLTIIGILIAGVMVGTSMVRTARQQKAVTDFSQFKQISYNFYEKYYYWPGDIPDASSRWSGASNGDGDGTLEDPASSMDEYWDFWHHLKLSEFLEGNYTGAADSVPSGAFEATYITHFYTDASPASQAFLLGGDKDPASTSTIGSGWSAIGSKEAYYIDNKMDDGAADTGNVMGNGDCLTSSDYDITSEDNCSVYYYYLN